MRLRFTCLKSTRPDYRLALAALAGLGMLGYGAAHYMDANGHYVTGMTNQVVWGIPHVFAIGLILAASGALNVASLWSVFAIEAYNPLARLSALLAIALLLGGLAVLVLDLGRPERLIIAMTHYNFKSVFAWNIFLYTGFVVVAVAYLVTQFEHRLHGYTRSVGMLAFLWRFILTGGSGAIFGFLVARPAFDAAILVPLFIALSLTLGSAVFVLVAVALQRWHKNYLTDAVLTQLARLLGWFIAAVIFLTAVFHLTNLYATEHHGVERFILLEGGVYPRLFWGGQLGIGGVLPLLLLAPYFRRASASPRLTRLICAAALVVSGGFAQLYVIIIGGQAFPSLLFPGKTVTSSFYDGAIATYTPSLPELLLGIGGIALALLVLLLVMRVLPFLPDGQAVITPDNHRAKQT